MADIVTDLLIDAPADRVWRVLTDLAAYPSWNPLFRHVHGKVDLHETLTVTRTRPDGGEATDHPKITLFRSGREIRWRSRPLLPFLLDTERGFKIERLGPDKVRFVHWLARSGLLTYVMSSGSDSAARDQLELMNLALKAQAEHSPSSVTSPQPAFTSGADTSGDSTVEHEHQAAAAPS